MHQSPHLTDRTIQLDLQSILAANDEFQSPHGGTNGQKVCSKPRAKETTVSVRWLESNHSYSPKKRLSL